MFGVIPFIILGIAMLNWISVWRKMRRLEYITKPAVMVALMLYVLLDGGIFRKMVEQQVVDGGSQILDQPRAFLNMPLLLFVLGLAASMFGDIFLMLPREQFKKALISFLIAHVFYIFALNTLYPSVNVTRALILAGLVSLIAWWVIRRLSNALKSGNQLALLTPVRIYATVISLMLFFAWLTLLRPQWDKTAAIIVAVGATFFYLSDSTLAWNRFVHPISNGKLKVRITYHIGQIFLIVGALIQFMA